MKHRKISSASKRTVKFLEVCKNKKAASAVLAGAPDSVIKSLCDISLNALKNPAVRVGKARRQLFQLHRSAIAKLTDPKVSIENKRKSLQHGGFAWIPAIIGTVLGALGTGIFGGGNKTS
jgi:hypothetical protein